MSKDAMMEHAQRLLHLVNRAIANKDLKKANYYLKSADALIRSLESQPKTNAA